MSFDTKRVFAQIYAGFRISYLILRSCIFSENTSLQQQLVIDDIEPAMEFLTDLLKMGDLAEAQLLMQVTATYVVCRDAGHQGMKASRPTIGDQVLHHAPTDAFARMRRG